MTSPSLPKDHLVIKNQTHYQEAYGLEYKKDGKTNAWFAPDYVDPLTYLHVYIGNVSFTQAKDEIVPYFAKNFKSPKMKVEIHPFCTKQE